MKIEYKDIDKLIPYVNNTRTHDEEQVLQIASSIKEFGFTNPILIDADDGVIAGHGRIMAAKKLDIREVPCIVLSDLTEAQKKAYIIADNKLALNAGWDEKLLKLEIGALHSMDFDIELLGFDSDELNALDIDFELDSALDEDKADEVPELVKKSCIKHGDIIELGITFQHRIMCGSATEAEDIKKLMNNELADQLVTDPPYNVAYEGKTKEAMTIQNDSMDDNSFRQFLKDSFQNANDVMKEGGGILCLAC